MQEMKISLLERENYELSNMTHDNDEKNELLEQNLKRFEEERRQFEREKLKFLEDKRELDRLRLQRFERYKREIEAKRIGLKPNFDIDNPYDYMLARKIVIDYKVNASGQDSGSDSEPDITVVENVPKSPSDEEVQSDANVIAPGENQNGAIKTSEPDDNNPIALENHLNGKELPNGPEKPLDQTVTTDGLKLDEIKLEKVDYEKMKFWQFIWLLLREARQIWCIHKRQHSSQWRRIKSEIMACLSELILLMVFCGMGGLLFRYTEGNYELTNKTGVKRVKRDFIDQLWTSSHNLRSVHTPERYFR